MSDARHIRLIVDYKNLAPVVCGLASRLPYFTVFNDLATAGAWTIMLPPGEHAEAIAEIDGHYIRDYIIT